MHQQILHKLRKTLNNINNIEKVITKKKIAIFHMEVIKKSLRVSIHDKDKTKDQELVNRLSISGNKINYGIMLQ